MVVKSAFTTNAMNKYLTTLRISSFCGQRSVLKTPVSSHGVVSSNRSSVTASFVYRFQ